MSLPLQLITLRCYSRYKISIAADDQNNKQFCAIKQFCKALSTNVTFDTFRIKETTA